MVATHLPKPKNWQDFEHQIWVLARCVLVDPDAQMNGRQGQAQSGVDVFGIRKMDGKRLGIQCKKHWEREVTENELTGELAKAKGFTPPIDVFILATTAPRDAGIQEFARNLTEVERSGTRPIQVSVWSWEDIEERVAEHVDARKAFDPDFTPYIETVGRGIEAKVVDVGRDLGRQIAGMGDTVGRQLQESRIAAGPRHHPHDERLLESFRGLATSAVLSYLRDHDFGGPVPSFVVEPFERMGEVWRGADYEFSDVEVQAAFTPVMACARQLADLTMERLYATSNPEMRTVKNDEDRRTGRRAQVTLDAAKRLNDAASALSKAIDDFLRVARAKITV